MPVKYVPKHVVNHDEFVLACQIHDFIENILNYPELFLKAQVPHFDFGYDFLVICEGEDG